MGELEEKEKQEEQLGTSKSVLEIFKGMPLESYYDYFYSAANAYIYISSVQGSIERNIEDIPFISIGYSIEQTQKPIFGFWDRTPRGFAPGRSLVMGSFAIPHTYVNRLEEALRGRSGQRGNTSYFIPEREQLKDKYWGTRYWSDLPEDPERKSFPSEYRKHLFYAGPLFDISIVYGIGDEISFGNTENTLAQILQKESAWGGANDVSWQIKPNSYKDKIQRETIQGAKITAKTKSISVGGQPIIEEYTFMAKQVTPF